MKQAEHGVLTRGGAGKPAPANDFAKGSMARHILDQAIPLMVAQILQLLYNVVDRVYIGHLPDSDGLALTGIGLVFPIITLISAFTSLFGMGGAPLCSIARGAGKKEEAERILGNSAVLLFFTSVVLMAVCYLVKKPVLYLFGASDATWPYADAYLSIYLAGTVFVMTGNGLNNFITSQGFPKTAMATTLLGALLNLILDPILIFGFDMGVRGAAVATVFSQIVSALWVLRFLTGRGNGAKAAPQGCGTNGFLTRGENCAKAAPQRRRTNAFFARILDKFAESEPELKLKKSCFRLDPRLVREITTLGLSGFIMAATSCVSQVACNAMLSIYGGDLYVGIMTILNSIREIIQLPVSGITNGAQPVLGFNYGAGKPGRVRQGIRFTTLAGGLYTVAAWTVLVLFPKPFLGLFTGSREMIEKGVWAVHLYFAGFVFMLFQFCGQSVFVALGRSKNAIFFSLLRKIVIVLPLTLLLPRFMSNGTAGVFLAEPISNVIGGLACYTTMYLTVYRGLGKNGAAKMPG